MGAECTAWRYMCTVALMRGVNLALAPRPGPIA
jgi:hypothetical protein